MQTEVPTLPVVHFNAHTNLNRKHNSHLRRPAVDTKASSSQKTVACFSSNKKHLHPLLGQPYQSNVRQQPSEHSKRNKTNIQQRVLSAKMLRIKELQNQLADAHYQLNELANENRLLKALQKKQDSALKRYEGTNAELPRIINSHHEELRILQIKYKKLKTLHKETCDLLKEKEIELQHLQSQNKHLLQLSKDRNLGEREKLQLQVSDLNHRIQQQQDTIQTLHRKLSLESKSLKHQLSIETSKRKDTQKNLEEAIEKLKSLENFLDNREKRLYYNGQLLLPNKNKHFGTQSLTNLRDISSSNPIKLLDRNNRWQTNAQEYSLPTLRATDLNDKNVKTDERINSSQTLDSEKSETMAHFEQIRKYRLQKSGLRNISSDDREEKSKELDYKISENSKMSIRFEDSEKLDNEDEDDDAPNQYEISADTFKKIYKNRNFQKYNELLKDEATYLSESSENENENYKNNYVNVTNTSRELHTRLVSSADNSKELPFSDCKYRDKLKVLVQEREDSYESDSEIESGVKDESAKDYVSLNHPNEALKLISSTHDNQTHSDKELEELTASGFFDESHKIYQNLINEMQVQLKNTENENLYNLQYDIERDHKKQMDSNHLISDTYKSSGDLQKYLFEQYVPETQKDDASTTKNELENKSLLQTFSIRDYEQVETCNKIEASTDSVPEKSFYATEILFDNSQSKPSRKNSSNTSDDLVEEKMKDITHQNDTDTIDKNMVEGNYNIETRNKLNKQEENKDLQSRETDTSHDLSTNINKTSETKATAKIIGYNKEKLLATMKAIDDNENIEFLNPDYGKHIVTNRKQITENLYRGLPTHMKKRQDIINDIFDTDGIRNKPTGSCSKLHS